MYSVKEISELLKVNYMTAWKMVKSGKIPSIRTGNGGAKTRYRIRKEDLDKYFES